MSEEEIITQFVNSKNFTIIESYISKTYEETIDELTQENRKLKECYCNRSDCAGRIKNSAKYESVAQERDLYKSVIDKIRRIIIKATTDEHTGEDLGYSDSIPYNDILGIIDKALESE